MRASFSREPILRPTPSTEPALFLEARAPVENTPFDACHADPPRVVAAGRAFTTKFPPTSDVPFVARRHPQPAPSGESSSYAPLSRSRPTTPTVSRPPTHPNESLRSRQMLRPRRLSTTSPERTCSPGPHLRHRGEAMTQPRPRTPSTVSTDRELAPTTHAALNSELNTRTTRSPFHRRILPRAASGGYPRSPTTSAQVSHNALLRCTSRPRDACDRFLPCSRR